MKVDTRGSYMILAFGLNTAFCKNNKIILCASYSGYDQEKKAALGRIYNAESQNSLLRTRLEQKLVGKRPL